VTLSSSDHDAITALCQSAKELDAPHVDIGPLLGASRPVVVGVDDLHQVLLYHQAPGLSIHWDGGDVEVKRQDGGAMATLTVKW
jgi:hypothetical protein